ncbi:MAG: CDP-alcohol phosphatidyltransferase family protein, partial [Rhodospirillales bacterium]|nr:CDP-alcohol phosphatidyltransferase family protein [Rhodospirillales bacterium]
RGLRALPLIRQVSRLLTPVLMRLPVTANQVTAASLVAGLAASALVPVGGRPAGLGGGVLLFVSYALDNCDGEIARLKNQATRFGERFDNFTDWVVHATFFAALGVAAALVLKR